EGPHARAPGRADRRERARRRPLSRRRAGRVRARRRLRRGGLRLSRRRVRARPAPRQRPRPRARARSHRQRPPQGTQVGAAHARHAPPLREARLRAEPAHDGTRRYEALKTLNCSWPRSHTEVGGEIATSSGAPPKPTRSFDATGSQGPLVWSPVPATSGEKRASALAEPPGASVIFALVGSPACSAITCVGRSAPFEPISWASGSPVT